MRQPVVGALTIAATLIATSLLTPYSAAGQAAPEQGTGRRGGPGVGSAVAPAPVVYPPYSRPQTTFKPPKTKDGQPDISGTYLAIGLPRGIETPRMPRQPRPGGGRAAGEYSFGINERPKLPAGAIERPGIVDPADGKIPLTQLGLERRREILSKQDQIEYLDGRVLCLPPGNIRTTIPAPVVGYQILQTPGYVKIFYEQSHLYRSIPLDGRKPLDPRIRKAMGVSRGHWEGNTLVVEVTNFTNTLPNNTWILGAASVQEGSTGDSIATGHGIPHTEAFKVTERYTPIDANVIHYEAKIEDPAIFTQPVIFAYYAFQRAPKDYVPIEYACFEGNAHNLDLMVGVDISGLRVDVP